MPFQVFKLILPFSYSFIYNEVGTIVHIKVIKKDKTENQI